MGYLTWNERLHYINLPIVEAAESGISLLHGNCHGFSSSGDPLLRSVYNYWRGINLTGMNRTMVYKGLREVVMDIIVRWVVLRILISLLDVSKRKLILKLPLQSCYFSTSIVADPSIPAPVQLSRAWSVLLLVDYWTHSYTSYLLYLYIGELCLYSSKTMHVLV